MTEQLRLDPIRRISGSITLPGSKSLSNRVLLLAMLSEGETLIENLLDSDDVRRMVDALAKLKISYEEDRPNKKIRVRGVVGRIPVVEAKLFLGNAGTAIRPLTAALTLGHGRFVLDGIERMRERPIQDLLDGLNQLGAHVRSIYNTGCPPVEIIADGLLGGVTELSGAISSQYLSAILLTSPYAKTPVEIRIRDHLVSIPYVEMTIRLMSRFGVNVVVSEDFRNFYINAPQNYQSPETYFVEGDASSASYFLAGAAITGGSVTVVGCGTESLQGDAQFAKVLEMMGAEVGWQANKITVQGSGNLKGIDMDMNEMPDAAMTLAVTALFAKGTTAIRNIYNWRLKETERLKAVSCELKKLGASVDEGEDYLIIVPPRELMPAEISTYDDHRMAMAFSLAACSEVPITILNPTCVNKTFPDYFNQLSKLTISNK
ncbi:MAG: 3-phosphoshikimate 1-carboxyvinyltransferase [SAR324 cluster bacterium]|uniref:3-phosphoshikimate 1-carboxyvinyltransferase n=1 Tax=SAR324 cluster bacterium TaxID=2024889 RepID=A0A2D6YJB6_9DELT|nr:3-phosphoshikimate 1-carboxyvinyltransferase [SAR324 cluster bacterium]